MSRDRFRKKIKIFFTRTKANASGEGEVAPTQSAEAIRGDAAVGPSMIGPLLKGGLNLLGEVLGDLDFPGASACRLVITAVEKYEAMKLNVDALNSLKKHCDHVAGVIVDALKHKAELPGPIDAALKRFGSQIDDVISPCEEAQKKHVFFRIIMSREDAAKIQEIFDKVGRLIAAFVLEITLAGYLQVNKAFLAIEKKVLSDNIDKLKHVEAAYDSNHALNKKRNMCLAGTRTILLEEIARWAAAGNEERIYLLTGHAGFGKSTIVRTVAERLDNLHILGASFFFSRDDADLKSNSLFFSTLAYQLCLFDAGFAEAIGQALQLPQTRDAVAKSPATQLERLIVEPLKIFNDTSRTVVIVVDALDECEDFESPDGEAWGPNIWNGIAALVNKLPFIRVFLTSRPHQHLTTLIERNPHLYINNTSIEATDPDIRRYLRHELVEARKPPQEWIAKDPEISALEVMAAGLFIVAVTVVRFVLHPRRIKSPSDRIRYITEGAISGPTNLGLKDRLEAVNTMYRKVLDLSLSLDDSDELRLFQTVVGSIIFLREQFDLGKLARFLGEDDTIIRNLIDKLQAIITLTDDKPQFHKSFVDYITNAARSGDRSVPQPQLHTFLALRCFHAIGDGVDGSYDTMVYGARNIQNHCTPADPSVLIRSLSAMQTGSFWIEVASCLRLLSSSEAINMVSPIILGCMGMNKQTQQGTKDIVDILNVNLQSEEVLSEKPLRLMMTSRARARDVGISNPTLDTQYLKSLLLHLSNDGIWQEPWILPNMYHCFRIHRRVWESPSARITDNHLLGLFLGKRGDGWTDTPYKFRKIYGTFEPTHKGRAILRQKLLESTNMPGTWSVTTNESDGEENPNSA